MHSFAIILGKPRRSIPVAMLDLIREPAPPELAFDPEEHVVWCDDRGTVAFGGWQTAARSLGIGSHWDVGPDRFTAFSGLPWRHGNWWSADRSWARQLDDHLEAGEGATRAATLAGTYSIVSLTGDGHGFIVSDPLGLDVLYIAETKDVLVISSRPGLAARLVAPPGQAPARDVEGVGWLALAGFILGDRTGYQAVRTTPQGATIHLHPVVGPTVRPGPARPWWPGGVLPDADIPSALLAARDELAASVRALGRAAAPTKLADLSGGRDSRVILSLLVSEGVADQFAFTTYGSESLPDGVVASKITARFGLDHRTASTPMPPGLAEQLRATEPISYARRLQHHVAVTDGMVSSWDLRPPAGPHSPNLSLSGLCGEPLRTVYPTAAGIDDMHALTTRLPLGMIGFTGTALLTSEASNHYAGQVAERLAANSPEGCPQDAVDGFYLSGRLRRVIGTLQGIDRQNRVFPLYSLPAIRAAFAIGAERRRAEVLPFEVMRASCEELAAMPFAGKGWPEAAFGHLADADRYRHLTQAPARAPGAPTTVNQEHQARLLDEQMTTLREVLDVGDTHPVFDVIDRDAVLGAIDRFPDLRPRDRRSVHGAVSAVLWASGAEEDGSRTG